MKRSEVPIHVPCGADWSAMTPESAGARACAACDRAVHDLTGRSDEEVRALLAQGPTCVRYLHDASGKILSAPPPPSARIVPASALLEPRARRRWLAIAAAAASTTFLEACGGNNGLRDRAQPTYDVPESPEVENAPRPTNAPDASDASEGPDASDASLDGGAPG